MTVIVYRSGILASDSLSSFFDEVGVYGVTKLTTSPDGWVFGFTGPTAACYQAQQLYKKGFDHTKNPNDSKKDETGKISGLAVSWKDEVFMLGDEGWYPIKSEYCAIGSGSSHAVGALAAGASATQAVEIAIKHNPFCGGDIIVICPTEPKKKCANNRRRRSITKSKPSTTKAKTKKKPGK